MDMFSGEIQAIIQSKNTLEQGCNIQAGLLCVKQQSPQTCTCTALAEHTGQEIRISSFNTSLLVNYIVAQDCPFIGFFVLFTYLFIHMKTWKNIESSSTQVSFFVNSQSIWQTRWLIHQSPLKVSKRNCNTEVNYWFWIRLRKLCFIAVWVSNKDF